MPVYNDLYTLYANISNSSRANPELLRKTRHPDQNNKQPHYDKHLQLPAKLARHAHKRLIPLTRHPIHKLHLLPVPKLHPHLQPASLQPHRPHLRNAIQHSHQQHVGIHLERVLPGLFGARLHKKPDELVGGQYLHVLQELCESEH